MKQDRDLKPRVPMPCFLEEHKRRSLLAHISQGCRPIYDLKEDGQLGGEPAIWQSNENLHRFDAPHLPKKSQNLPRGS